MNWNCLVVSVVTRVMKCQWAEMGFGAVCYARYSLPDGTIKVSFVMARNRVAPLKRLSIPRLELQAAVLAVRLYCVVKQELTVNIKDSIFENCAEVQS